MLERVVAFGIIHVDRLPRRQDEDLGAVLIGREPASQLALVESCDAIQPAEGVKDASLKKDRTLTCRVMNEVLDVHSQRFLREPMWIRPWTQSARSEERRVGK